MMESKEETADLPEAKKKKNKRRFSDEQIRSLEFIFESESTKLEARKKMQLARELGLQPRQVAIWFQNKRARWKSKQIELDYAKLRDNYDSLASGFESLIKEKESLLLELQMLNEQLGKPDDGMNAVEDMKRSDAGSSKNGNTTKCEIEMKDKGVNKHCACGAAEEEGIIYDSMASWFNLLDPSTTTSSSSHSHSHSHWLNFSWI